MSKRLARHDRNHRRMLVIERRLRGLSQADVAKRLGVRTSWVRRIEQYDSDPRLSELRRYERAVRAIVDS
jgi:ribosome-binding protein aMBF1 (putative translation factor)